MMTLLRKIEWTNFLFLLLTPLFAIGGIVWLSITGSLYWQTFVLTAVMMGLTGLSITAGYHRLFTHKSFRASRAVKLFFLLFGGAGFEGSAREWCKAHRKHHAHVDHEDDPYNITKGFWHAHVLWVIFKADQSDESNIPDLLRDPLIRFQDRFYIPLAVLVGFSLPTAVASLWGDPWGGFFIAGVMRVVINHHLTFLINSYCHFFGKQPYSDQDTSRDSWLMAFFTYGEGYHNFHHAFQADYRNGLRPYQFDPTKWFINLLAWLKLASHLHRAHPDHILKAKLAMDEKKLKHLRETPRYLMLAEEWERFVMQARQNIERQHERLLELKAEYRKLKQQKIDDVQTKLAELRRERDRLKQEYAQALASWKWLLKTPELSN